MKSKENKQNDQNLWYPTPKNPEKEEEHTPIQRRILKKMRELIKKEESNPTKDQKSRKAILHMFHWE